MAQNSHAGRPSSWLAVIVIWIGFGTGGVALVPHPKWWLFWVGVGIAAVGGVIALSVHIFDDVIMDGPRQVPEERHHAELAAGSRGELGGSGITGDPATTRRDG
jgi:hypothetical protein